MKIKICGLSTEIAVDAAVAAGADAVGFVLAASPRQVSPARVAQLAERVPEGIETFAVFTDPDRQLLEAVRPHVSAIQADANWFAGQLPFQSAFLPVFNDGEDLVRRIEQFGEDVNPPLLGAFVVDSSAGGGSGTQANWERAATAARLGAMVLAGGLDPENVASAILAVRPHAVDVSSGVESSPGVKDPGRIRAFIEAARGAQ